ncbi:hypothetical protein L208DRAFT_1402999 [Tricholoma matsutake]|nr:hypothetical protein L208DRAFT_1402999 [Tricholoma matsutake 945]
MVFGTSVSRISSRTSLHMFNQWIRVSSDTSKLITMQNIYNVPLIVMMQANAAWHEVDTTTIRNCWKKAAILPPSSLLVLNPSIPVSLLLNVDDTHGLEDPVTIVEKQLESALDELVSTGALQASNRMDIEALLNPADKSHVIDETTDEEICQAVLDAQKAQEEGLINGGDNDVDDDAPVEPCPTCRKVLQAAAVINKYIDGVDDPSACKLEGILASFKHQMQLEMSSMNSTHLTDHFHRI